LASNEGPGGSTRGKTAPQCSVEAQYVEAQYIVEIRDMIRGALDRGVTHFDLANDYGPAYGSAEENFGIIPRKDFRRSPVTFAASREQLLETSG
jgi:aryl-alcohol dehydrogenase-like predicted oxidoreductase